MKHSEMVGLKTVRCGAVYYTASYDGQSLPWDSPKTWAKSPELSCELGPHHVLKLLLMFLLPTLLLHV